MLKHGVGCCVFPLLLEHEAVDIKYTFVPFFFFLNKQPLRKQVFLKAKLKIINVVALTFTGEGCCFTGLEGLEKYPAFHNLQNSSYLSEIA